MLSLDEAHRRLSDDEKSRSFLITNPREPGNPIVFANMAFFKLTGYSRAEVLGRNCRFLQGDDTDQATIFAMSDAISRRQAITVDILNYKKDGTRFWNHLILRPQFSDDGELKWYLGLQHPVPAPESVGQFFLHTYSNPKSVTRLQPTCASVRSTSSENRSST